MIDLRKNRNKNVTAQAVLDILRDKQNYFIEVDYCHPERLSERDKADIILSADYFRDYLPLSIVEEEIHDWSWVAGENIPDDQLALIIASNILDSNADHSVYNTITIYLTKK